MKRIVTAVGMTVLAALMLSGCAPAADAPAPEKPAAAAPVPDPDQRASLVAELQKIDPALDTPKSVMNSERLCRLILRDIPEKSQLTQAKRFFVNETGAAPDAGSDEAAQKIIDVIKTNGFCQA